MDIWDCDQVASACQADALNVRSEASIIGCLTLLVHVVPDMSDKILLDVLPASCFPCLHFNATFLGRLFDRVHLIKPVSNVHPSICTYMCTSVCPQKVSYNFIFVIMTW